MFGHDSSQSTSTDAGAPAMASAPPADANLAAAQDDQSVSNVPAPSTDNMSLPDSDTALGGPSADASQPSAPQSVNDLGNTDKDALLDLKQDALKQLSPLISHLDQSPEEKFRTTMMMIQAADDQKLLKEAYDAAQKIPDEKARAQALLDIINEINYFTQQQAS